MVKSVLFSLTSLSCSGHRTNFNNYGCDNLDVNWFKENLLVINYNQDRNNKKLSSFQFLKIIKDEMIYGGYFAALSGPAFIITMSIMTKTSISLPLLVISYLIPLMVYSYDYYKDMDKDNESNLERSAYFQRRSQIYPYLLGINFIILSALLLLFTNQMMISFIFTLIISGVLYTVGLKNITKEIPAFKNIYTTLTWSLAGTFSVMFYYSLEINLAYLLIFLFIFLKFLPNTIFYDLKDIKSDQREGLKTIPVLLGKQTTLKLLHRLNIIAFIPLFLGIYMKIIPLFSVIMIGFLFYSLFYLNYADKADDKKLRMISYTLADAEFMIWPIILVIGLLIL